MKTSYKIAALLITGGLLVSQSLTLKAGNEDRAGQAGATQLLVNPWARSSGFGSANSAGVRGLEAMYLNVAGMAFTKKTELLFTHTNWLSGTDISVNAFGFSQRVGETGVLGLGIVSMDLGKINITTTDMPEGGIGVYSPQLMNLSLAYSKAFSDNIYGGLNFKVISESIADAAARGVALDAGIQYVTGDMDRLKLGIALKNVGPRMQYRGDGLSFTGSVLSTNSSPMTVEQRTAQFELPSLVNIGLSYDFYFSKDSSAMNTHKLTVAGTFNSNSFSKDQYRLGVEYSLKNMIMLRAGYDLEKGGIKSENRTTALTGPCAGFTVELPFGTGKKSTFGIDYSYRATNPFNGVHSVGARINL